MSIANNNRSIALKALAFFEAVPDAKIKDYANAVQKAMFLLGTQGLRRTILYITSQMGKGEEKVKNDKNAWRPLYEHLASFDDKLDISTFQYEIVHKYSKEEIAIIEPQISFFLLCLKRLANAKITEMKAAE